MKHIVISLGSNLGKRMENLSTAQTLLADRGVDIAHISSTYETEPYGNPEQDLFLNQVAIVETEQSPENLMQTCLDVEDEMGRVRNVKNGPRNIDIDVLFYKDQQLDYPYLQVPHPELHKRKFVLEPLQEIMPEQMHPRYQKSIRELYEQCSDKLSVNVHGKNNAPAPASFEVHSTSDEPALSPAPGISLLTEEGFKDWIRSLGDDPEREGLNDTYRRFVESREELFSGYRQDPSQVITLFDSEGYDEMIISRDIDFFSTCEHHLLPFHGRAHIGYIPGEKIIGLSKFARVLDLFARRMQNQERLTTQVANFLQEKLQPRGLGVILDAEHLCIKSRGADKQNSLVTTSSFKGSFKKRPETRAEFLSLISRQQ